MKIEEITFPDGMREEVYEQLEHTITKLKGRGLLDEVDTAALVLFATNYDYCLKAKALIDAEDITIEGKRGLMTKHPAFDVYKTCAANSLQIMKEFGLTTKSRSKIPNAATEQKTALDMFLESETR